MKNNIHGISYKNYRSCEDDFCSAAFYQSVEKVLLAGMIPLGAVSHRKYQFTLSLVDICIIF